MTRSAFGLVLSALLAGVLSGCSSYIELDPQLEPVVRPPPPLLTFVFPLDEQQLSAVDDVDADEQGLQIDLKIRVRDLENDLALNDIALRIAHHDPLWVPVEETSQGRMAIARGLTLSDVQSAQNLLLTAIVSLEEEGLPHVEESVRARVAPLVEDGCDQHLEIPGDLTLEADAVLPGSADCLTVGGDLIIVSTERVDLDGLEALVEVRGSLIVENNLSLTDLDDLNALRRIGGDLLVVENPALSPSDVAALIDRVGRDNIGGDVVLDGESM